MFGVPLPWALCGAAVIAVVTYFTGHHKGWTQRDAEMQVEIARKNEESRAKEQEMAKAVTDKDNELRKANDDVAKKQTDLNRLIASGRMRLPAASCVQASPSAAPAPGNSPEAGAKPDGQTDQAADAERETLQLIAQIAADGDKAINQLNACIDAYNEVRNTLNGQR
jgi:flagellar capping protein FliD